MGRNTKDFAEEMESEKAKGFKFLCIIIGFEEHTEFVFSENPNRLAYLNELVANGGEPIGLAGMRETFSTWAELMIRPFKEYENEEWVHDYLNALPKGVQKTLIDYGVKVGKGKPEDN